jgi:YbbR domain-containing protein
VSAGDKNNFSFTSLIKDEKTKVFSFFLVVTIFIWLLVELSKTYNSSQKFTINFKKIPENLLLEKKSSPSIELRISSPGFSLLKYKMTGKKISVNLSGVKKNKKGYFILPNNQLSYLSSQVLDALVLRVVEDTLYVNLGKKITKKIPVAANLNLKFKQGYNIALNGVKISPDSITVSGSKNILDTLKGVETVLYSRKRISSSIRKTLPLALDLNKYAIKITPKEVEVNVEVKKFTEGSITLPVKIKNIPRGKTVVPYPNEIKLIYRCDIDNFKKIKASSFAVEYDFKQYLRDTLVNKLSPVLKRKNIHASSVKIVPEKIDFIIEKK